MRKLFVSMLCLLSLSAFADSEVSGQVVTGAKTVKVKTQAGAVVEYGIGQLSYAHTFGPGGTLQGISYQHGVVMNPGIVSSCVEPYLGQLAEAFSVTVKLDDNSTKEIKVDMPADGERADVFGSCADGSSKDLFSLEVGYRAKK